MVNAVNERVLTRVCRNHEIGVTCYMQAWHYRRNTRVSPFHLLALEGMLLNGGLIRRPRLFRGTGKSSESCRGILDRMAISWHGKDKRYEFRSILSLCPVNMD